MNPEQNGGLCFLSLTILANYSLFCHGSFSMIDSSSNSLGNANNGIGEKIRQRLPWVPEEIRNTDNIPTGDMPGDKVKIGPEHVQKSRVIFPGCWNC